MKVRKISSYRDILAVCDSDLIGKSFEPDSESSKNGNDSKEENNKQVKLDIKESFYNGSGAEEKPKDEVIEIMKDMKKEDATFNLVGKETINAALEADIINKEDVKEIQGIPYIMVLL